MTVTRIWDRTDRVELPSVPAAAFQARQYAARRCAMWRLPDVVETVELLVSELVTNAVKAGQSPAQAAGNHQETLSILREHIITLGLSSSPRELLIEVWDASKDTPVLRGVTDIEDPEDAWMLSDNGRGLVLVDELASSWGYRPLARGGKIVWALLGLHPTR